MREISNLRSNTDSPGKNLFTHQELVYHVLNEYEFEDKHYAIMQMQDDASGDMYLFQIKQREALDIEDENEWDRIVEAIDELYS